MKKQFQNAKPGKGRPGSKREPKRVIMFDDAVREEYLTGFHKRKLERRKAAVVEIKNKIKDEQKRVREERHKEYMRLLEERREALDEEEEEEEEDELEDAITATTESVQYDHPNHTVTVTTISDLDLSGCGIHGPATNQVAGDNANEEGETEAGNMSSMPKKSFQPILNKKICSLNASLHSNTKQGKRIGKAGKGKLGRMPDQKPARGGTDRKNRLGRTSKKQRRKQTGKRIHHQD